MNKKRFNKHFDEIGRRSRVKMHKSGKNWVRTVLSQISLLRVIRGKGQAKVTLPIIETNEELRSSRLAYLQALLASGAAISGTTLALNTFAEEQVAVVEQQVDSTDTLVDKNIVVVENVLTEVVSEESVASDTGSATASEAGSVSASTSGSFSASQSASVSLSSSESASLSVSVSASTSASVSVSTSASESASTSMSMSVSSSLVEGKTSSIGAVGSENSSEPSGSKVSESSLVAVESRGALSYAPSTDLLAPTDALAQPDSTIVAMATASSEVATGLVATSLNSSSSSQSETAQMANSLDYTNLDNAIASLQHALSYPEVDATTTTASRYKRYETALKVAKAALEESLALREDSSLGQDKIETMALIAGQAAISLTGRINQIQAAGGKFAIAEGTDVRAVTQGSAGTDVSSSGVINFRRSDNEFRDGAYFTGAYDSYVKKFEYDYDAATNLMKYRISITPVVAGKVGIGLSVDATSTFGLATVTGGGTLESQSADVTLSGDSPKGRYFFISGVRAGTPLTFEVKVHTNGSGINKLRFKTVNINTTNDSGFNNPRVDKGQEKFWINPSQGKDAATIGNNPQVKALFTAGGTQTIYTKTEDAPVITDNLTDKSTSITGTGTPYSTVTLTFSNGAKTTTVVQANGTWTATPPSGAMAASTTVSAVQDTGKAFPAKDDGIQNDVLNSQENRISAATVATIRDTTRPVVAYPNQVYFFYNTPLSKDLVLATVTEVSNPDTWQKWGISRADDTGTHDNEGNLNSMLVDDNGSPVSLGIRQVSGTTNRWEIYMPAGSMIAPNNFKGSNLAASEQDFFTRWPFVVDAAGNRNYLGTETENPGIKLTAVAVPSGYINKAFGETATATEIQNVAQSWTSSGRFFDGTSPAKRLTYVVQDSPPPTNVTKTVPVAVTTGEGISTTATVLVNYPPSFSNVSQNVYVFSGEPTKVDKQVATITETIGQTFTTQTANASGLTVNTSGIISTGQTFTGAVGSQTVRITATDNYNNSNSTTVLVRSYNVSGGSLTRQVGTKVTETDIKNLVKATATGGGTGGLTGSGLDNIASYSIISGYDHQPTLGQKTVRVRVTLTDGNYKDVDVQINYRDTTAPTVTTTQPVIYVFDNVPIKLLNPSNPQATSPVADKLKIATVADVSGVATTADIRTAVRDEYDNKKGLTVTVEGSTASPKEVFVSGQTTGSLNLPSGFYNNFVKIADTQGNATTYQTESAKFRMHLLDTSITPIGDRDIDATGFTRVTTEEILNAVSVDYGTVTQAEQNAANVRKVLLSNTDTDTGDTPTVGQKTATVRVYTASNTYKDVEVTFTYVDSTRPRITTKKDVSVFVNRPIELIEPNTAAPVIATDSSTPLTYSMPDTSGVTVNATTGKVQGTLSASGAGYYTRAVTVRDAQGNSVTSENFWIRALFINNMGSDGTITALEREYGLVPTVDDIKNHVTITGVDGNDPTITKEVLDTIPQNVNGSVRVRLTTSEGVRTVVTVPITYTNQRPVINVPAGKEILRKPVGQATTIDLSEGVTVRDREDDRSPSDSLTTSVKYEIVDSTNQVVRTVEPSTASKTVDITNLPAGDYTVRVSATDSGATTPVVATYPLRVNVDTTPPTVANAKSDIFVFKGVAIDTDVTATGNQPLKWATVTDDIAVTDIIGKNNLVGLTLDLNGNVTGTSNSGAGFYSRSLTVTDGTNSTTAVPVRIFVLDPVGGTTTRVHGHHV
ncbi:accessory Sec-dependent serine-rich glycoprotein adhesin, partial [Streptococcus suis]|uniref:accessory Sec-dependent serine-rich glycoprotein adhesin n=1 Tax=Streptococcus suis TaxID=1307 RepID=UPI0005167B3B